VLPHRLCQVPDRDAGRWLRAESREARGRRWGSVRRGTASGLRQIPGRGRTNRSAAVAGRDRRRRRAGGYIIYSICLYTLVFCGAAICVCATNCRAPLLSVVVRAPPVLSLRPSRTRPSCLCLASAAIYTTLHAHALLVLLLLALAGGLLLAVCALRAEPWLWRCGCGGSRSLVNGADPCRSDQLATGTGVC
jgi:hypothetical protein